MSTPARQSKQQCLSDLVLAGLTPRGLSREQVAAYCGVSVGHFDTLVRAGAMPQPKQAGRRLVWDRAAVDLAFSRLPAVLPDEFNMKAIGAAGPVPDVFDDPQV